MGYVNHRQPPPATSAANPLRLLDQVRDVTRRKHFSLRTEQTYVHWIKRFILFHGNKGVSVTFPGRPHWCSYKMLLGPRFPYRAGEYPRVAALERLLAPGLEDQLVHSTAQASSTSYLTALLQQFNQRIGSTCSVERS